MDNTNAIVKKNNRYIRSTLCYSEAQEKKIILLAISKVDSYKKKGLIKDNEPKPIDFYLSVSEIKENLEITSNDIYKQLKETSYKIASRMMEYDDGTSFVFITPFPYCKYENGILHLRSELSMFDTLVNYNDSSGFTQYLVDNLKYIKGTYTISGYEYLHSYLYLKNVEVTVEEFKKQIGVIEAVPKNPNRPLSLKNRKLIDKCPRYIDLKRKIIEPMKKDLEKYTDIKFTYEPREKLGKKVISLLFTIEQNTKNIKSSSLKEYKRTRVMIPKELKSYVDELKTFLPKTTKNKDFLELLELSNKDVNKIREMYNYTKAKGNRVKSPLSYVKKGLKDGWLEPDKTSAATYESEDIVEIPVDTTNDTAFTQMSFNDYSVSTPTTKNKFNAYPQRNYSKEYYDSLEQKLMGMDYFKQDSDETTDK